MPPNEAPPPGMAGSAAKPISNAELKRELGNRPTLEPQAPSKPLDPSIFTEEKTDTMRMGDEKGPYTERLLPDFKQKAQELLKKKEESQRQERRPKAEPVVEEKKPEETAEKPKVEAKTETAATPATPTVVDEEVPEDQRRVLPHDKPDTAKRIKHFLREIAKRDEALAAKAKEVEEARKTAAPPEEITKLREQQAKLAEDLARYRRRYDWDSDPETVARYDEPRKQSETLIEGILQRHGGEAVVKAVKDAGGFAEFSRSGKVFEYQVPDPENEGQTKLARVTAQQLAKQWLDAIPIADAEAIRSAVGKQRLLSEERQAAMQKAIEDFKSHEEKIRGQTEQQAKAAQESAKKAEEEFEAAIKPIGEADWIKDRVIPEGATPEQRKEIEEWNKFNAQMRSDLRKHPKDAKEYADMKVAAVESHHLRRLNGTLEAKVKELEAQLKKQKEATRTTGKGGSLLVKGGVTPRPEDDKSDPTDVKSALRRAFAARGTGNLDE